MDKKRNITKQDIIYKYMHYVVKNGKQPNSMISFSKELNMMEQNFQQHYTSFNQIESEIYIAFYNESLDKIMSKKNQDKQVTINELLAFYHTFFELMNNNRNYIIQSFGKGTHNLKETNTLSPLKIKFKEFIRTLRFKNSNTKTNTISDKNIIELAWNQFLFIIKFWIEDTSDGLKDTDLFIEKSVMVFNFINE